VTARQAGWPLVASVLALAFACPAAASDQRESWYVSAAATGAGDGSRDAPLGSLRAAERASRPGDTIVVLPAPRSMPPLDGGIALKPRQRLVGGGPSVLRSRRAPRRSPRITNTHAASHSGDAVRLADGATVRNLVIVDPHRGGIYGRNVTGVVIRGNDVSGHNTSCTDGFHIPGFVAPTNVPGVGIPVSTGLRNGWAGIMVDARRGEQRIAIRQNLVHHAECGDGIDVRAFRRAEIHAEITANVVKRLRQGDEFASLLAIGLQASDDSRLVARLDRNRQTRLGNPEDVGIGPEGADSEGVFVNASGPAHMRVTLTRNRYTNPDGLGGFSANGMEMVSMGDGSRMRMTIRHSSFTGTPGDVIEEGGLGTNARLSLRLVDVVAARSVGPGNTGVVPFNNGDCLLAGSLGAGNTILLTVRDSELTDCANNGLGVGANVVNGSGPTKRISVDVADSVITGNRGANLGIRNFTDLDDLAVKVERTDLSNSRGTGSAAANAAFEDLGTTDRARIDLGGGALESVGRNCLAGGQLAADVVDYDVVAERNWWGTPGGPGPGRTMVVGGSLDHQPALAIAPAGVC
jgi:Right handed beta helix region